MKTFTQFLAEKETFSGKMYGVGKKGQTPGKMWANPVSTLMKTPKPFDGMNFPVVFKNLNPGKPTGKS